MNWPLIQSISSCDRSPWVFSLLFLFQQTTLQRRRNSLFAFRVSSLESHTLHFFLSQHTTLQSRLNLLFALRVSICTHCTFSSLSSLPANHASGSSLFAFRVSIYTHCTHSPLSPSKLRFRVVETHCSLSKSRFAHIALLARRLFAFLLRSLRRPLLVSTQNHDQLPTIHILPFSVALGFDLWLWFSIPPSLQPSISSSRVTPVSSFDGMESSTFKSDNFVWDLRAEADESRLSRSSRSPSDSNSHYC
jgi:hypothetical protein